ncbi:MAG: DegT/DnrJ/EryC1/StrS family aminotransferase [Candidatus Bipolaricaulota bacterium]|nr:DegT/DnrJ/EryC1/StrS family aminotransferase [Candidatus Bipolaricaulota bacterium]
MLDLTRQYNSIRSEIDAAIGDVLKSGEFILGPHVKRFEDAAAAYCGVKHAIGLASGTDALLLSLRALGVGPGDAVLVPSFTFFATAGTVHNVGATPIFCDIDPKTYNIDPASARRVLEASSCPNSANPKNSTNPKNPKNPKNSVIRDIIPVHLYGQMADMDEIMQLADEYNLAVIEDAAQAIGAQYRSGGRGPNELNEPKEPKEPNELNEPNERLALAGSLGSVGCFSFYPTKNLGAYGDAGMVTTNDDALAETIGLLRVHGAKPKYFHKMVGINSRLDAIQAAILDVKLRHLDDWSNARRRIAELIYYPRPLHLQECFAHLGAREGHFPHSEAASREVLSLPIFPELTENEQDTVVAAIRGFAERRP